MDSEMSHRDTDGRTTSGTSAQELKEAMKWLLAAADGTGVTLRRDCGWKVQTLVMAALLWVWSAMQTLGDRFQEALDGARRLAPRGIPKRLSYQAFMKLLVRHTASLVRDLMLALRRRMQQEFPKQFRIAGLIPIAVDGSHVQLPRTLSNEERFSPRKAHKTGKNKKNKRRGGRPKSKQARRQRSCDKKADSPQMSLTMLLHVGLRLPWDWRIGPSDQSEREHLRSMIDSLQEKTLLLADAGFAGYDLWSLLLERGHQFVIRVGGNVQLLKNLGKVRSRDGLVYLWPAGAAKKGQPPRMLRLVVLQGPRHPVYLVTSILDPKRLSDRQVAQMYRRRWSVEVFFRHFKQTYGRCRLRSRKAEHAECEMQWSLLGLWTMLLYAHAQQRPSPGANESSAPRVSVAKVLRAFGWALSHIDSSPPSGRSLVERLGLAVIDCYQRRDKRSRGYPRKKYETATKPPCITLATKEQRQRAKELATTNTKKGLTA